MGKAALLQVMMCEIKQTQTTQDQTCSKQTVAVLAKMHRADNMSIWKGMFNVP